MPNAFVYVTRGPDSPLPVVIHRFAPAGQIIVVANACPPFYVEDTIAQFPNLIVQENTGNPEFEPLCINRGLRIAHANKFEHTIVITDHLVNRQAISFEEDGCLRLLYKQITWETLDTIGYLTPNFQGSHYWMDYALRARAADIPLEIASELIELELLSENQWDIIKFGSIWGIPTGTENRDFWEVSLNRNTPWSEDMKIK